MLSAFVGPVDFNAALVLIAFFAAFGIPAIVMLTKRRSRVEINNDVELAKYRQETDRAERMLKAESDRDFKFKQLDQNLITSHSRE